MRSRYDGIGVWKIGSIKRSFGGAHDGHPGERLGDATFKGKGQPLGVLAFSPAGLAESAQGVRPPVVRSAKRMNMDGPWIEGGSIWNPD